MTRRGTQMAHLADTPLLGAVVGLGEGARARMLAAGEKGTAVTFMGPEDAGRKATAIMQVVAAVLQLQPHTSTCLSYAVRKLGLSVASQRWHYESVPGCISNRMHQHVTAML